MLEIFLKVLQNLNGTCNSWEFWCSLFSPKWLQIFWTPHLFSLTVWRWILVPAAVSAFAFLLALMVFLLVNAYFVHFQVPTYLFDSFGRRRSWEVQLFSYLQTSRLVLSPFLLSSRSVGRENIWHLALSFSFFSFWKKNEKADCIISRLWSFHLQLPLIFLLHIKKKKVISVIISFCLTLRFWSS